MLTGAAVTALTRTSVCALGRHPRGPRTASGASSSHIGRSEERSHPRLHRLPIDDQAATARNSGLMTSSSPPPLRSLREIVPLPTINHKAGRAGFLQSPSLDVAQGAALTACTAIGRTHGESLGTTESPWAERSVPPRAEKSYDPFGQFRSARPMACALVPPVAP
jgi:hypothetical protein